MTNETTTAEMIITATADQVAELPDGRIVIAKPGELPDDFVDRTKQLMHEMGVPQGSDDPVAQWMGAPPLGPITDPPGRVPPDDLVAVTEPCQTCGGRHQAIASSTAQRFVDGRLHSAGAGWRARTTVTCTDCAPGVRPLFELVTTTKHPAIVKLVDCCLYVPGPLLPVVDGWKEVTPPECLVVVPDHPGEVCWVTGSSGWDRGGSWLPAPSAAGPGWYAAIAVGPPHD